MTFAAHLPGYKHYDALKDSAFRMGVYIGICLFAAFAAWLVVANRFPIFDRVARERNILAIAVILLFAAMPILRFFRNRGKCCFPRNRVAIFSFLYRVIEIFFAGLASCMAPGRCSWLGLFFT